MAVVQDSVQSYPTGYTTSGSINGTRYKNAVGKGADTSAVSGNDYANGSSSSKAYIYYSFEFDGIPDAATIDSVACQVKGHAENTSRSTCNLQLFAGDTAKGSVSKFTSTSAQTLTLTTGTWSRSEIDSMKLRFEIGYYGGLVNGATVTVTYSYNDVKWTVSVSGDNVTPSGDTEVSDGGSITIKAYYDERPVVTDNGVDVSGQLVQGQDQPESWSVEHAGGTSYGFDLNANGYYESNNQGHSNSTALAIVRFHMPVAGIVTFSLINYAESTYDFGLLSEIDGSLSTAYRADSSGVYWSGKNNNSSSVQTVTYNMPAGDHEIYVKYFKDQYTDDGNDSLQFKVAIELSETPVYETYWAYTIAGISTDHAVVVSEAVSNAIYFKNGSAWVIATTAYKKVNGAWVVQSDLTTVFDTNANYIKG